MALDVRKLRYFVSVFEEGSFSRAAERENIVQPALSTQIKQLETELCVKLFERSTQGIQPTPAGQHFYKLSKDLLRTLEAAGQQMRDFGGSISGFIRVGIMPSICRGPLATILTRYSDAYPDVEIKILEAYSGTLADQVIAGALDFAICNRPASQTELKLRLLHRDRVILVSGPTKKLTPWKPCRLAHMPDLKLVLPSSQHSLRRVLDKHIKAGRIKPARIMEMDGLGATMRFVQSSDWSTTLPSVAVIDDAKSDTFIMSPIASPELSSDIYELHLPARPLSLPAQKLVQMVHEELLRTPSYLKAKH